VGGHYEFNVMPFGLVNATAVFQRTMDRVLRGLEGKAACFVDDIILASDSLEEHLRLIEEVLQRLQAAGLRCHPKKCKWFQPTVNYLGHVVGEGHEAVQEAKVSCITAMPAPRNVGEVRSFLGMVNYYRRHIIDYSSRARALNRLTRKEVAWDWGEEEDKIWQDLEEALRSAPVLCTPVADLPYQLATDWSSSGRGAVLSQHRPDGSPGVIADASKSCNSAAQNDSSDEGRCWLWCGLCGRFAPIF